MVGPGASGQFPREKGQYTRTRVVWRLQSLTGVQSRAAPAGKRRVAALFRESGDIRIGGPQSRDGQKRAT